jgi:hypothetical protein
VLGLEQSESGVGVVSIKVFTAGGEKRGSLGRLEICDQGRERGLGKYCSQDPAFTSHGTGVQNLPKPPKTPQTT